MQMKTVFYTLHDLMSRRQSCVLVSAVGGSGSVPRKICAHMLVTADGRLCGTVGGGAIEGRAIDLAKRLMAEKRSCAETFVLNESDAQNLGMICGGRVTLHFKYASFEDAAMCALAEMANELFRMGKRAWLIIGLESGRLSLHDGYMQTGASVPAEVIDALQTSALHIETEGERFYAEQLVSSGRTYIFGGGHVAQALVPVLVSVDFRCVVLEDREEFADPLLFPLADDVRLIAPEAWEKELEITEEDCICIMTRGHKNDLDCQAFALRTEAYYIGVIGSRKKVTASNEKLLGMGFTVEDVERMHTPIGLPIRAQTPAEIAVSIAAEMIQCRAVRAGI